MSIADNIGYEVPDDLKRHMSKIDSASWSGKVKRSQAKVDHLGHISVHVPTFFQTANIAKARSASIFQLVRFYQVRLHVLFSRLL